MAIDSNAKELIRGDTGIFSLTLYHVDGTSYAPSQGDQLIFYLLKKDCDDLTESILTKDISIDTMQLELAPLDTRNLDVGSYPYRIRLIDTAGHEWTVVKSKIKLVC